jgi:hypothetical protein
MNHEKTLIALLFLELFAGQICAQIIPQDRLMDWTPGVTVGVPGGIPNRTTIGFRVDSVTYGTGTVDASAAIGAAIDSMRTRPGQVVYIPAGTYRLDSRVYRANASNITIRGAGTGKTILKATTNAEVLLLGSGDWPRPTAGLAITGGATKGSTVLTVADASSITVGKLVRVEQNNLPYVITGTAPTTNTKAMSVMFKVTAKTSTSVTVFPPLPFDFTLSPALVQYSISPLINTGVEDLTVDCNSISWAGLEFDQVWGCWIKNVEVINSTGRQMFLVCFVNGEVRHNYTHSVVGGGPNHEGIDFYEDGSFNLIEDNITYNGGFPGIIFGDSKGGCVGNVIAYNFSYNANTGASTMAGMDISVSHGPHNMMNLVEGNIAGGMGSDGYFGSTSHILLARNWFTATHPTGTDNLIAVNVGRWNNYFSLVGNVLGTSSFSASGLFQPVASFSYASQVIYKLGFPNMGNNGFSLTWGPTSPPDYTLQSVNQPGGDSHGTGGNSLQELDLNVKNTMIRHGNYDYLNHSIAWEPAISDHGIPNSYFRSAKPWFFGTLAWPPFDPISPPGAFNDANISKIPAGYRYVNGIDPPGSNAVNNGSRTAALFAGFGLKAGYSPINQCLRVTYRISKASYVDISIIDLNGRLKKTLVSGDVEAGSHQVMWKGNESMTFHSGVYCIIIKEGGHSESIRVLVGR